jgi:dihydroflavonol-4-reductase
MKTLVTGATGFLGRHLVGVLEAAGHEVVPYARSTGGDVLDLEGVARAAAGCEGAFHCAGPVSHDPADAELLYRVHVEGTKTVIEACRRARVKRVVVASTSGTVAVSDSAERPATEDDPAPVGIVGRWPYYRAKLFAERAALERSGTGIEVVSVNPSLLLGPGDERGSSTDDVRRFLEGRIAVAPAGGLSFVDARDAAEAMWLAMERGRPGERYLVSACNLSVRDFLERLARIAGTSAPLFTVPASARLAGVGAKVLGLDPVRAEMATFFWYVDAAKAQRELDWRPRDPGVTLYETVDDLFRTGRAWPRDAKKTSTYGR